MPGAEALARWEEVRAASGTDYELAHITQPIPVATGVAALDRMLGGGIPVGTFTAIGGEAGCGKSALACLIAYNAARDGRMPVFFSMEMPATMVISRMLSVHTRSWAPERRVWWSRTGHEVTRLAGIDARRRMMLADGDERYRWAMRYGAEHGAEDVVLAAWRDFRETMWPRMAVVDNVPTVEGAVTWLESLAAAGVRPLAIIDYIQLAASGEGTEYEVVTEASHRLAGACKRLNIPMVVLSSLRNIGMQERAQDPQLSWFRGSGHIGYDAGTAIILRRAEGQGEGGAETKVRFHVIKNRVGRVGDPVTLAFNGGANWFGEEAT